MKVAFRLPALLCACCFALSAEPQVRYSPFWAADAQYVSTLHLRNNLVETSLSVTPVLHAKNGSIIALDQVSIPPSASTEISLNDVVPSGGHGGYGATAGGAVFHFDATYPDALSVETEVIEPTHNLAYSIQSFPSSGRLTNKQHAVYYLPTDGTEVYFAMFNASDEPIVVRPLVHSGSRPIALEPISIPSLGFSSVEFSGEDANGRLKPVGGVTLTHEGPPGALFATGWLEDEETGFSTMMTFEELHRVAAGTTLYGAQIFAGSITSQIVLKNMSSLPLKAAAEFLPVQNGVVGTSTLDLGTIPPNGFSSIDIAQLQQRGLLPRSLDELSMRVTHSGENGALMGRIFGISSSGTYGYYSQLEDRAVARRAEIYWTAKADARTVATIANFGSDDTFVIDLFDSNGNASAHTLALSAGEARTINLARLGAAAFGEGSSGGWNVSREGQGAIVIKNHVVDGAGLSLPFYGASPYVDWIYLTGPNPVSMDSDDADHTFQCRKHWSNGTTSESPGGSSVSENTNVVTIDSSSDQYGYWDVQAVGPGGYIYTRIEQVIPETETQSGEQQHFDAQIDNNVKCKVNFSSFNKNSNGNYTGNFSVSTLACGSSINFTMGVAPQCSGATWGYVFSPTNAIRTVSAGGSDSIGVVISLTSTPPKSCVHRANAATTGCSSCEFNGPTFIDGVSSDY